MDKPPIKVYLGNSKRMFFPQCFFLTVSSVALVAVESSGRGFFPVKVFFKCFLTSLLNTQWKKKMNSPWIILERKNKSKLFITTKQMQTGIREQLF